MARAALGEVAKGNDPAAEKQASRASAKAEREADVDRIEKVVELFISATQSQISSAGWRRSAISKSEVSGRWRGRRLSQLTRAHIHEMTDAIIDRGTPVCANRIFEHLSDACAVGRSPAASLNAVHARA